MEVGINDIDIWERLIYEPILLEVLVEFEESLLSLVGCFVKLLTLGVQFVGHLGPLPEVSQLVDSVESFDDLHSVDQSDPLDSLRIVRACEEGEDYELLTPKAQYSLDISESIELYIIFEHPTINIPATEEKSVTVLSDDPVDNPFYLKLGTLSLGLGRGHYIWQA